MLDLYQFCFGYACVYFVFTFPNVHREHCELLLMDPSANSHACSIHHLSVCLSPPCLFGLLESKYIVLLYLQTALVIHLKKE